MLAENKSLQASAQDITFDYVLISLARIQIQACGCVLLYSAIQLIEPFHKMMRPWEEEKEIDWVKEDATIPKNSPHSRE